jgi:hypothetical protein
LIARARRRTVREAAVDAVGRWLTRLGRRRIEREFAQFAHPPEIKPRRLLGFGGERSTHVFRSLVQVNFFPRAPD